MVLVAFGSLSIIGCGASKKSNKGIFGGSGTSIGGEVAKTVVTVVGLILLTKLIKSVLGGISGSTAFTSLAQDNNFKSSFNEDTKISSFAQSNLMRKALQVVLSEKFEIPLATMNQKFQSLQTVGQLAIFVGENASAKSLQGVK